MISISEVRNLLDEGRGEQEIANVLKQRGSNDREIYEAISQAKIKNAVDSNDSDENPPRQSSSLPDFPESPPFQSNQKSSQGYDKNTTMEYSDSNGYSEMQPSILSQETEQETPQQNLPAYSPPQYAPQEQPQATYPQYEASAEYPQADYQQYQPYQGAMSSDVVTEIAEQVVSEKLSFMEDRIEKAIDFRTTAEAKIGSLGERLRRIELLLDAIQVSLMQKMGNYVNDVQNLKHELHETQKSFSAVHKKHVPHAKHKSHP